MHTKWDTLILPWLNYFRTKEFSNMYFMYLYMPAIQTNRPALFDTSEREEAGPLGGEASFGILAKVGCRYRHLQCGAHFHFLSISGIRSS